jgi:hypothetical protein
MKSDSRKVFNGLALAVVQSQYNLAGSIRVSVSSPGLKGSAVEVLAQKSRYNFTRVEDLKR